MRLALFAPFALVATAGCAAPLTEQAREAFASDVECPVERAAVVGELRTAPFERYEVRGCGLQRAYVCSTSTGCDPAAVRLSQQHTGPSASDFPPSLVDQAPPPPPPPLDYEDGS
jgi:hypothetical protein